MRCRLSGSWAVWFWLARIIRGSSQQVKTKRGVDRESVASMVLRDDQPVSEVSFSHTRLAMAIVMLWRREVGQSHLGAESQMVGRSMIVGIKIFNIAGG